MLQNGKQLFAGFNSGSHTSDKLWLFCLFYWALGDVIV